MLLICIIRVVPCHVNPSTSNRFLVVGKIQNFSSMITIKCAYFPTYIITSTRLFHNLLKILDSTCRRNNKKHISIGSIKIITYYILAIGYNVHEETFWADDYRTGVMKRTE